MSLTGNPDFDRLDLVQSLRSARQELNNHHRYALQVHGLELHPDEINHLSHHVGLVGQSLDLAAASLSKGGTQANRHLTSAMQTLAGLSEDWQSRYPRLRTEGPHFEGHRTELFGTIFDALHGVHSALCTHESDTQPSKRPLPPNLPSLSD